MQVRKLIEAMLPKGSLGDSTGIDTIPVWPADVFAIAATLVDRSSGYTRLYTDFSSILESSEVEKRNHIAACWQLDDWHDDDSYRREKDELQTLWTLLVSCSLSVYALDEMEDHANNTENGSHWIASSLSLMILADEACSGLGFGFDDFQSLNWIQRSYLNRAIERSNPSRSNRTVVQQMPYTACECVADSIACVQPKTRTPGVGCTLRSLTHNLALLPPAGVVRAHWNYVDVQYGSSHSFNLLIIPVPYEIPGRAFKSLSTETSISKRAGMFGLDQPWLKQTQGQTGIVDFVIDLIEQAQRDVERIDGVVLPELALDPQSYSEIAVKMSERKDISAQFLVAGVLIPASTDSRNELTSKQFTNAAVTTVFTDAGSKIALTSMQKKQHRWKLDKQQIGMYSLGNSLNPERDWWENANISDREMSFYTFRSGACFTTLVCEDLARADPGQRVIRAIGPNVVIALLMDGPQLSGRWPGRYAMGLAEDPGSSVLSLTSAGLLRRSNHHFNSARDEIALWQDSSGEARSLRLKQGEHALTLNLTQRRLEERTLDHRGDGGSAYHWVLSGCLPVVSMIEKK